MSHQKIFIILWTFYSCLVFEVLGIGDELSLGIEKANHAFEVVCEYEVEHTQDCKGKLRQQHLHILRQHRDDENAFQQEFGHWAKRDSMSKLPEVYGEKCGNYLEDRHADPPADESDAMQDAGIKYPYKAFAHCMMQTLRMECGGEMPPEVEEAKQGADAPEDYN